MRKDTFRKWLAERGCHFDHFEHAERSHGHVRVTIHREGRTAEFPAVGARHRLDDAQVRRVCEDLGLDWKELPGPRSRA
jgi:hypothetical protein